MTLTALVESKASLLKEFWFDVDGVMTPQGRVMIYEMLDQNGRVVAYERHEGFLKTPLIPMGLDGQPILNRVEYLAAKQGQLIAEGYGFDPRDGKVVEYLRAAGFPVYFISGRNSPVVRERALALGATPLLGEKDKLAAVRQISKVSLSEVLFIGDGIQDVSLLQVAGLTIAPDDACPEALQAAHAITVAKGGGGVISEVISIFLKARGLWPKS